MTASKTFLIGLVAFGQVSMAWADDAGMIVNKAANFAAGKASSMTENSLKDYIPTAEVDIKFSDEYDISGGMLVLVPIFETDDNSNLMFSQGSLYHYDDRTTVNIGLGYRHITMDDKLLLGVNAFYDHEFPYDHQRASIGGELRTTVGEINTNYYWGMSGWKQGRPGTEERAMDGYDLELGVPLPYLPTTKARGTYFKWMPQSGSGGEHGFNYELSTEILPGFEISAGHRDYSRSNDENYAKLTLNVFDALAGGEKAFMSDQAYQLASIKEARYDKVRRENLIRKETRATSGNFVVTVTGF